MILSYLRTGIAIATLSLLSTVAAAAPAWKIIPSQSSLTFTATQNNSPVSGKFKQFSGTINFDPDQLSTSAINIVVDIASVSTSYAEVGDTLKTPDWFDAKLFPQAVFKATQFTKTGSNNYEAHGILTIRDKSIPVTLAFTLKEFPPTKALATGETTLKRNQFGLGKGEWAKTDEVKDDVKVDFVLSAQKI